jgi:CRISPR-associated endonuclease/helicase Cas3
VREHQAETRLDEVKKLLKHNQILLTNPDLIHLIMSHQYGWDFMRKELAVVTSAYFDYFVFDEFHVFGPPQVVAVVNMLSYLTAYHALKPEERKKYLFLSATPNTRLERMLEKVGLRPKIIEGHYSASSQPDTNRCILQGCDVTITATDQQSNIEQWVEEHIGELRAFSKSIPTQKRPFWSIHPPRHGDWFNA